MPNSEPLTNRAFAALVKTWLTETIRSEIDKSFPPLSRPKEELGTMLQKADASAKRIRAKRFREALTGLESLLMGVDEIDYRAVLDRVLHNIGAHLQALDILMPQTGLEEPVEFDYRALASFPAKVSIRRYVKLPRTTEALLALGVGRFCPPPISRHTSASTASGSHVGFVPLPMMMNAWDCFCGQTSTVMPRFCRWGRCRIVASMGTTR